MELSGRAVVGTIVAAEAFAEARTPAFKLTIDFGDGIGVKRSSAQLTDLYTPEALVGRQVVALVDLGTKRIAGFVSEVLVLGLPSPDGVVLLAPERPVADGAEVY